MEKNKIQCLFVSDSSYDKLILEAYYEDTFLFLLNWDDGIENLKIEISGNIKISYMLFIEILEYAKNYIIKNIKH